MSGTDALQNPARVAIMGSGSGEPRYALVIPTRATRVTLWARRPELAGKILRAPPIPTTFPTCTAGVVEGSQRSSASNERSRFCGACRACTIPPQQPQSLADPRKRHCGESGERHRAGQRAADEQVIAEAGQISPERIVVVTGPDLAREIAERQPSASVVASVSPGTARAFQTVCHTSRFRAYTNTDVIRV